MLYKSLEIPLKFFTFALWVFLLFPLRGLTKYYEVTALCNLSVFSKAVEYLIKSSRRKTVFKLHVCAFSQVKQSSGGVLQKMCSQKYCKIHRKTPVPESLLTLLKKILRHRWLRHWCFPVNFVKFSGIAFLTEHLRWLLLKRFT